MSASSPARSPSASPSSPSGSLSSPCCADDVPTDRQNMSPRSSAGSTAGLRLASDRTPSPGAAVAGAHTRGPNPASTPRDLAELDDEDEDVRMSEDEEDEIDVTSTADDNTTSGSCGLTPSAGDCSSSLDDEYFKPIKKLCMVQPRMRAPVAPAPPPPVVQGAPVPTTKPLTSFFIRDILSHKPPSTTRCRTNNHHQSHNGGSHHVSAAVAAAVAAHAAAAAAAAGEPRGIVRPWDCGSSSVGRRRPRSADDDSRSEKSAESDSPESPAGSLTLNGAGGGAGGGGNGANANSSPLDALFEMTSKAFEGLEANEKSSDGSRDHLNLFSNRQQPKKKRKSRTAFTNHQIFELEKRFLYQKYLSPADRDEIAQSLGLTNAQVITWFQNRRAKLKRDMEELKKDVDATTKVVHTTLQVPAILDNIQDLSLLKKDTTSHLLHKAKHI